MSHVLRSQLFRTFAVLLACVLLTTAVFAQSSVDGAIGGTVNDQSKAVVPGAKVTVRNIETNATSSVATDEAGKFRIQHLQPGTYDVTVNAASFGARTERVIVEVGRLTGTEIVLSVAGSKEAVEVTADAPVINTAQQDFSSNINQAAINDLPINGRRWSTFALLTPGANPDGNFGLISFRGISGLLNNNTVDGGDNNQAFFSEERGRTRASYVISQSSVREFQVNSANYSAEYGRAAGAVVNTVTKSGTNSIHGEAWYYIRDNALGATNPFTTTAVKQADGSYLNKPTKPLDRRQEFGGNFGGSIIKDKLFYFFNYDGERRTFPGIGMPNSPSLLFSPITVARSLPTGTTCSSRNLTEAQILYCRHITQAQAQAGVDYLASTTGEQMRTGPQDIFFPKIDYRISQNNTVSMSYNRMRRTSEAGVQQSGAQINRAVGDWGNDMVKVDIVNARLTSLINPTTTNEFRFSWGRDFEYALSQTPVNPVESPLIALGSTLSGFLPETYINSTYDFGRPYYLERYAYPDEHRTQFSDTLTKMQGKHLFKFGLDISSANDLMNALYQGGGSYSYSNRADWITDYTNLLNGITSRNFYSFSQTIGPSAWEFTTHDYAAFIQDDIRLLPRLTLNLGVRWEYEQLPKPQVPNPLVPQTQSMPHDRNNFGPRVGFAWDVFGDGKTAVRGGYGLYYGRIINSTIADALNKTGAVDANGNALGQAALYYQSSWAGAPAYPNVIPANARLICTRTNTSGCQNIAFFDPRMQSPQIHQADLIIEREIAHNTVVSASYLMSLGRELVNFVDTNMYNQTTPLNYTFVGGPFDGRTVPVNVYTYRTGTQSRPNASFNRMTDITSNINSSYNALVLEIKRRMTNGLQFQSSYTWAHALDQGQNSTTFSDGNDAYDPYNSSLEYGNSAFDIRHRFVTNVVWEPQFFQNSGTFTKAVLNGWSIAPILTFSSGRPFTEYVSVKPYLPTGLSYVTSGVNGSGGAARLAPLVGRNNWRYPWIENIDLRLSRRFQIREGHQLQVLAEAFNLFNHVEPTAVYNTMYTQQTNSNTFTYDPRFGSVTGAGGNIYRERQIQFGVRYQF